MTGGDGLYKIVKVENNAYKIELSSNMNISATFNMGDLTPYIKQDDEGHEDLRANSLQGEEIDAEQVKQCNLLNHIMTLVRIWPMVGVELWLQGLKFPKSLLTWGPSKIQVQIYRCRLGI